MVCIGVSNGFFYSFSFDASLVSFAVVMLFLCTCVREVISFLIKI